MLEMNNGSVFGRVVIEIISIMVYFVGWNFHVKPSKQDPWSRGEIFHGSIIVDGLLNERLLMLQEVQILISYFFSSTPEAFLISIFRAEIVTINRANFGCRPRQSKPSPSACEAEALAISYQDDHCPVVVGIQIGFSFPMISVLISN